MQVLAASYTQHYTPVADNVILSAVVAALPIIVLLGLLGLLRVKAHLAALAGLVASLLVAMVVFGMPVKTAVDAATNGAAFGLFPIGWIVLCAIFVYDITVKTGKFEQVRHTIAGLAVDRRIQLLLIAFSFGAFIEGAAGFGTPIAICAAMLIGLGFRPLPAAGLSLIGNTAPVAFGAIGTPLITLASVTGLPLQDLSAMVGRQLPFFIRGRRRTTAGWGHRRAQPRPGGGRPVRAARLQRPPGGVPGLAALDPAGRAGVPLGHPAGEVVPERPVHHPAPRGQSQLAVAAPGGGADPAGGGRGHRREGRVRVLPAVGDPPPTARAG
jgi:hypothetical protein